MPSPMDGSTPSDTQSGATDTMSPTDAVPSGDARVSDAPTASDVLRADVPNAPDAADVAPPGPVWTNIDTSRVAHHAVSGRVNAIRVDPRSADVVYIGTSEGGVWKSTNYTLGPPTWAPITDSANVLAVGGLDLDPQQPDTVYVGLGDPFDTPSGTVIKSTDGGAHWVAPVQLAGASHVRDLRVDPGTPGVVLVATDVGLFRSTDAGASFTRVVTNETWSLAYVGAATWIVSSITGAGGDLLRSTDDGVTWNSARNAGLLPVTTVQRMTLGAGDFSNPSATVLYVMGTDSTNSVTSLFRSTDGGAHWVSIDGTITNPANGCSTTAEIMGGQGWFNQAVAVDPTNANHVLFGGELCGVRSLTGLANTPAWDRAADWVGPQGGPPYVHADWHAALVTNFNGVVRTYSGDDGGLFSSTNVWTVPAGQETTIVWRDENAGLFTQMCDTIASGDPGDGNSDLAMSGLQDNGTDFGLDVAGVWNITDVTGGDGQGVAIGKGTSGEYVWASVGTITIKYCTRTPTQTCATSGWQDNRAQYPAGDAIGNDIRIAAVETDPTGSAFLMNSQHNVWRTDATLTWANISGMHCFAGTTNCATGNFDPTTNIVYVIASQTLVGHYGVIFDNDRLAMTSNGDSSAPNWTISGPLPGGHASRIAFPTATPTGTQPGDVFLASFGDRDSPGGFLYVTHDRGATWQPFQGNGTGADLPGVGVQVVRYDPSDTSNNTIYVGTDIGVYRTTDGGNTWPRFGGGLPHVAVTDLSVSRDGSLVRISTNGRSLWEIQPH